MRKTAPVRTASFLVRWYWKYALGDTVLDGLELEAREARRGLWADPYPVPPWVYTNARRRQSLDLSDLVASTEKPFVMGGGEARLRLA